MALNENEVIKLQKLLENYKQQHGTISTEVSESINCYCGACCTGSCSSYCDGSSGMCWTHKWG